jgi:hypothetical protein
MMMQLQPPIPLVHKDGRRFLALIVIDYSPEHDVLWLGGFEESRELWCLGNAELRLADNLSLGRIPHQ